MKILFNFLLCLLNWNFWCTWLPPYDMKIMSNDIFCIAFRNLNVAHVNICGEHWTLKKKFMMNAKKKFPRIFFCFMMLSTAAKIAFCRFIDNLFSKMRHCRAFLFGVLSMPTRLVDIFLSHFLIHQYERQSVNVQYSWIN